MWPGVCSGSIVERAAVDRLAGRHRAGGALDLIALELVDQHRGAGMELEHLLELGDVVVMVMGQQHVRELVAHPLDHCQQRLDRAAGVDQHRLRAQLVGHQVGVRQPVVIHRALDDHLWEPIHMSLIHTCYRILDIDRSVSFYQALGFNEIGRIPIRDEAINVFMGLARRRPGAAARADLQHRPRGAV